MADNTFKKLKELDLSRDEVERLSAALKKDEFRKLLVDYVNEIQDPANKKIYEAEITQLEKERGYDVTFINPTPGYVIKTTVDGEHKCFVNVCSSDKVDKPTCTPASKGSAPGADWALPHSLPPPRDDVDRKGRRCCVYDVVFHPAALRLAAAGPLRCMVDDTALDAVERSFGVQLDRRNLRRPKLKYKGAAPASVIRRPSASREAVVEREGAERALFDQIYPPLEPDATAAPPSPPHRRSSPRPTDAPHTVPKYAIKHRTHVDLQEFTDGRDARLLAAIPRELVVEVNLPLLRASSDIALDVTERTVHLSSDAPAKYQLHLTLPYAVHEDGGSAKFDKDARKLIVTLPVKRPTLALSDLDSGVDSDPSPASPGAGGAEQRAPTETPAEGTAPASSFLDPGVEYAVPEHTCHVFDNLLAFTLNVRNVDDSSITKLVGTSTICMKFTSISSSFYPVYFAFCARFPSNEIDGVEGVTADTWDNNVVVQIPFKRGEAAVGSYYYGLDEDHLDLQFVEEPIVLNSVLQGIIAEEKGAPPPEPQEPGGGAGERRHQVDVVSEVKEDEPAGAVSTHSSNCESSGDELSLSFSPSKSKGILKRLSLRRPFTGRSVSESSLDDFIVTDSTPNTDDMSNSLKKTVRFNDVIVRQLYRSNSSILGQKKKNKRKAKNKKRAQERRASESENSEVEQKKEDVEGDAEEANDIFQMDLNA